MNLRKDHYRRRVEGGQGARPSRPCFLCLRRRGARVPRGSRDRGASGNARRGSSGLPAPAASAGSLAPSPPAARKKVARVAGVPALPLPRRVSGKGGRRGGPFLPRRPPWTRVAPSIPSGATAGPAPSLPPPSVARGSGRVGPRARTPRAFRASRLLCRAVPRVPQPAPRFPSQPPARRGEGPGPRVRGGGTRSLE